MAATWAYTRQVSTHTAGTAGATRTYTPGANMASVAVGSLLVVAVGLISTRTVTAVDSTATTGGALSAWTVGVTNNTTGDAGVAIAYAVVLGALTSSDTITLTFVGGTSAPAVIVSEFSAGAAIATATTDKSVGTGSTANTTYNSGNTATLAASDDLILGIVTFDNGTGTNTITPEVLSPTWQTPTTSVLTIAGSARVSFLWRDPQATTAVRMQGTMSGVASDHSEGVVAITATLGAAAAAPAPRAFNAIPFIGGGL